MAYAPVPLLTRFEQLIDALRYVAGQIAKCSMDKPLVCGPSRGPKGISTADAKLRLVVDIRHFQHYERKHMPPEVQLANDATRQLPRNSERFAQLADDVSIEEDTGAQNGCGGACLGLSRATERKCPGPACTYDHSWLFAAG